MEQDEEDHEAVAALAPTLVEEMEELRGPPTPSIFIEDQVEVLDAIINDCGLDSILELNNNANDLLEKPITRMDEAILHNGVSSAVIDREERRKQQQQVDFGHAYNNHVTLYIFGQKFRIVTHTKKSLWRREKKFFSRFSREEKSSLGMNRMELKEELILFHKKAKEEKKRFTFSSRRFFFSLSLFILNPGYVKPNRFMSPFSASST